MTNIESRSGIVPEEYQDILNSKALAHIATVGPKGEPQSSPVWFSWDGTYLRFGQTEGRQKSRNIQRTPEVAVSIVDPQNPLRYIEIRGTAQITEDVDRTFINSLAKKYMDQDEMTLYPPEVKFVIITVTPERTTHF